MNVVVVHGTLSGEPEVRVLASGLEVLSWDVSTSVEGGGTHSVPVRWESPSASVKSCAKGAEVMVLGVVRRRFFRAGGATQTRVEVLADAFANPRRAAAVARLRTKADERLLAGAT